MRVTPKPLLRISHDIGSWVNNQIRSQRHTTQPDSDLTSLTSDSDSGPDVSHGALTSIHQQHTHTHAYTCMQTNQQPANSLTVLAQHYLHHMKTSTSILRHLHYITHMPFCELRLLTLCTLHSPARPIRIRQEQRQIENAIE
jgi:hypothetical protein